MKMDANIRVDPHNPHIWTNPYEMCLGGYTFPAYSTNGKVLTLFPFLTHHLTFMPLATPKFAYHFLYFFKYRISYFCMHYICPCLLLHHLPLKNRKILDFEKFLDKLIDILIKIFFKKLGTKLPYRINPLL